MKAGDIIAGKWLVKAECEGGGQGTVYKVAEQNTSESEYALKFCINKRIQSVERECIMKSRMFLG